MAEVWQAEDKSFLVTGGANGLGAAYVEAFLKEGAKCIAIVDIAEEAGKELSQRLNEVYNNRTIFVKCDVSKEEDITRAFKEVLDKFERIDVIINNAGIMNDSEHVWRLANDVNWQGLLSFTWKGVSHMRKENGGAGGTIINISSIAAFLKLPIIPSYSGSKAAVLHFSLCLAAHPFYEKTNIRVLTFCIGPTRTDLMRNLVERSIDKESAAKQEAESSFSTYQLIESAVAAMVKMYQVGANGSVWLSMNNRTAEDITHVINNGHKVFENVVYNGLDSIPNHVRDE
ncbi:15-hydroxyprostaglandin dehydrogenase [NAD(+)]-like [Epargyreus clarus]|uniref:15-hydroxyprostaglandin dehydrogenase [NAD(+)]-like n=1 Tax=Epargyreus clarus TaxID=520877 RepID=UPI003C2CEDB3